MKRYIISLLLSSTSLAMSMGMSEEDKRDLRFVVSSEKSLVIRELGTMGTGTEVINNRGLVLSVDLFLEHYCSEVVKDAYNTIIGRATQGFRENFGDEVTVDNVRQAPLKLRASLERALPILDAALKECE